VTAETGVPRQAIRTTIALVTRELLADDVPRDSVLGDENPSDILAAMEAFTVGLLLIAYPGREAIALERLGEAFAPDA
jgi:hypothetical protein